MKRHPALQDLSRDHFTALLRATHVRRAAQGDENVPSFEQARAAFTALWEEELALHFDEEDTTLRPLLKAAPELLERLDADHADLRTKLDSPPGNEDEREWSRIAEHLIRHARWEEEHMFPWIQDHLDEEGLQRLWETSKAFRLAARGPQSIGPPRNQGPRPEDTV